MNTNISPLTGFDQMNLLPAVYQATQKAGYKTPSPIQSLTIPHITQGKDIIGQARTGTGKTAAFALPLLSRIDIDNRRPQVLVLTPTRELAIQVAESFKTYGAGIKGLNVLSIYGGQSFGPQLNQLKRGVHVVVGTPGRLMDHMRRKTVSFADLSCIVIDEADEMLHMGFIEDVEWILDQTPKESQTALFSATMPAPIRKIAKKYLNCPKEIAVETKTEDIGTIDQKYFFIKGINKASALVRILEAATFDGVIVFVKTKAATLDVAKVLENKGFNAEALNGDLAQSARERTVNRLKNGNIDILVATDVAARGLDVDRISHVVNYDMPSKVEPYIHRIGRTGRAGRTGEAIIFVNRNEKWMLRKIEKATKQQIKEIYLPSNKDINKKRISDFNATITKALTSDDLNDFQHLVESYIDETGIAPVQVAAALAKITQGSRPFFLSTKTEKQTPSPKADKKTKASETGRPSLKKTNSPAKKTSTKKQTPKFKDKPTSISEEILAPVKSGMERYRIEVGRSHGVKARNIVGAISNEAGLESKYIKNVNINKEFSLVDLPYGMPKNVFAVLQKTWVKSKKMSISKCA